MKKNKTPASDSFSRKDISSININIDKKHKEVSQQIKAEVREILYEDSDLKNTLNRILLLLKERIGADAIGIRLKNGNDYPYIAQYGFSDDFIKTENSLLELTANDIACTDCYGNKNLECTCGLVISGKADLSLPFFTLGGSFYTNNSQPLLELLPQDDPRYNPRNICIHNGFASVVLVPIRMKNEIVGLMQLNSKKTECFSNLIINRLESIASHIGEKLVRLQTEEKLHESEELFRHAFEYAAVGVSLISIDGIFIKANKALTNMLGYSEDELKKLKFNDFTHPDDNHIGIEFMNSIITGNVKNASYEKRNITKNGKIIWISVSISLIRKNNEPSVFIAQIVDITSRKLAEQDKVMSEEKFSKFFQNSPLMIVVNEIETGNIIDVNNTFIELTGYKKKDCIGKSITNVEWVNENKKNEIYNFFKIEKGFVKKLEIELTKKNNEKMVCLFYGESLIIDGKPCFLSLALDISERKLLEKQMLELNNELRDVAIHLDNIREEERTMLAREIHDEFGSNLSALKMEIQIMKNNLANKLGVVDTKVIPDYFNLISDRISENIKLVRRLATELRPEMLDELGMAEAVKGMVSQIEQKSGIKFIITIHPKKINADKKMLISIYRIIQELTTNIVRHSKATEVSIFLNQQKTNISLIVHDNGVGINDEEIKNNKSLGLRGIRERVMIYNGKFDIKKSAKKGTSVFVEIPI